MMTAQYTITGTLSDPQTVILDEPLALPAGRVRITVEKLPEATFWTGLTLAELAAAQGVTPLQSLDELWSDFWPAEEPVDDFIAAVHQWRREEGD